MVAYTLSGTVSTLMSVYLPVAVPELKGAAVTQAELGETGAYINAIYLYGWMCGGLVVVSALLVQLWVRDRRHTVVPVVESV